MAKPVGVYNEITVRYDYMKLNKCNRFLSAGAPNFEHEYTRANDM